MSNGAASYSRRQRTLGRSWLRFAKIAVALALLASLYRYANWREVARALTEIDGTTLCLALAMFLPQTLLSAWRWRSLVAPLATISLGEAVRHTLVANAWNLVTPSKLGEFSKAALLPVRAEGSRASPLAGAAACVVVEKVADVAALASLWALSWQLSQARFTTSWAFALLACLPPIAFVAAAWRRTRWLAFAAQSLALWSLHLVQIDLFLRAAGVGVAWQTTWARIPAAIFFGLLPVSFCGVGTRDSALVWLFADVASPATMAVAGLLVTLRYLIPGALGIPLVAGARLASMPAPAGSLLGGEARFVENLAG